MTRKEITEGLKLLEDNMVYFDELLNDKGKWIDVHELLFETIEALEQEPCEDCISRKALMIALIDKGLDQIQADDLTEINQIVADLPSVQPKGDAISREEVCDYIAEFVNHEYATDREREMVEHIIGGIQHLSSVQPKPIEGDAISRKAVLDGIEELKRSPWATDKRGIGFEYLITEALEVVEDLCVKREPSVTPKSKTDVLDKIRAEIESNRNEWIKGEDAEWHTYDRCLLIIDKYKAESEDKE